MPRPLPLHLTPLLISQAAAFNLKRRPMVTSTVQRVCETPSLLLRSSAVSPLPPLRYIDDSATSSVVAPRAVHHRVGPIVGACLGAAVGVLLVGLVLFWFFLRHRLRWATAQVQDVVPRSWVSDSQGGHDIQVVANHPSMSLDLTGAGCENESGVPISARSIEAAIRLNKSSSVLDISNSVENALRAPLPSSSSSSPSPSLRRSSLPGPIEPYVPSQVPPRTPVLRIHTNVLATSSNSGSRLSPPTPAQSSRSPIRPLPTPPTTPSTRRPRSAKAEETNRQGHRSRLARSVVSAEDFRSYSQGRRRSRAHSITSVSVEMEGYDVVQHHDGGAHARIDLPPPYYECLQAQATTPAPLQVSLRTMAQP
ncbi:hypothetical protein EDB87DRAFT_1620548 [Lactarius vividus]|nr:hypothetical protein EDB87DRAFT_1620548 [Lactarius vividus]